MDKQSKNIDSYTKKIVQEAGLESPSSDFTNNVMNMVAEKVLAPPTTVSYIPLISKSNKFILLAILVSVLLYLIFNPMFETSYLSKYIVNLNFKEWFSSTNLFDSFSKTTLYGIGFLALFLIQIPFLKKYMERTY